MTYRRTTHPAKLLRIGLTVACLAAATLYAPSARADHQASVVKVERLTHNVKRVRFKAAADEFTFKAGHFILLKLPKSYLKDFNKQHGTNHKNIARPYSFASAPSEAPYFDLIVKHYPAPPDKDVPPGLASTFIHQQLSPGDDVTFSDPMGTLYSPNESHDPIILVAGGVGASPLIGLLKHWFDEGLDKDREIYFFFGVRSKQDFFLIGDLADWANRRKNFKYVLALDHPEPADNWTGETGYINAILDRHFNAPLSADVYIAGSPIMIRETAKVLRAKQVPEDRIHHDPIKVQ